jgi:hypothetical protein
MIMLMIDPSMPGAPSAPPPAPAPNNGANFDFIMKNAPKPRGPLFGGGGSSTTKRLMVVVGGGIVLIILAIIIASVLGSSGKASTKVLIDIAQEQQEIVRVAGVGVSKSQTSATKNLAMTIQYSVLSNQQATLSYLGGKGHKLKTKDLGLKQNAKTDNILTLASQNNTFDEAFKQTIFTQLNDNKSAIKSAYDSSHSKSERELLQDSYDSVALILQSGQN